MKTSIYITSLAILFAIGCKKDSSFLKESALDEYLSAKGGIRGGKIEAPSNLTATPLSISSISLSWVDNSRNESGFIVERKIGNEDFTEVVTLPENTTQYIDTGLMEGTDYSYRLKVFRKGNTFAYSDQQAATTMVDLLSNLVAFYPFNGNANNAAANRLHGTVYGVTPTYDRFGTPNSAYAFNDNQSIEVLESSAENTYPFTVNFWVSFDTLNNYNGVLFKKYVSALWNGFALLPGVGSTPNSAYIYPFYLTGQGVPNGLIGGYGIPETKFIIRNIETSNWVQFTMTVDSTSGKLYLNGDFVDELAWRSPAKACSNNLNWQIGGSWSNIGWFKGKLDDLGVWQRSLTAKQIKYLFLHKFNP